METRKLTKIALLASILFASFYVFSGVLYLEIITLCVVLFALSFPRKDAVMATFIFTMLNLIFNGITIWSLLYVVVYVSYAYLTSRLRPLFDRHSYLLVGWCAILAFSTGMILDLPFLLFSKNITIFYLILGLKTSLIQAASAAMQALFLLEPLRTILLRIERTY